MRRGVTIIELVMVVIIIGIATGIAVPRMKMTGHVADAGVRAVRGRMQVAHRTAITRQSNVVVSFDLANQRLRIHEDNDGNGATDAGERVTFAPLEEGVRFTTPSMGRVDGSSASAAVVGSALRTVGGMPSVVLRRDGSVSSDVEVYLTVRASVNTEFRAIVIEPSTGKSDVFRHTGTTWRRVSQ